MSRDWQPSTNQRRVIDRDKIVRGVGSPTEIKCPPVITYPRRHTRTITVTLSEIAAMVLVSMLVGLLIFSAITALP